MMTGQAYRCTLCGDPRVLSYAGGDRILIVACRACLALYHIEFKPADDPHVTGRIVVVMEPTRAAKPS